MELEIRIALETQGLKLRRRVLHAVTRATCSDENEYAGPGPGLWGVRGLGFGGAARGTVRLVRSVVWDACSGEGRLRFGPSGIGRRIESGCTSVRFMKGNGLLVFGYFCAASTRPTPHRPYFWLRPPLYIPRDPTPPYPSLPYTSSTHVAFPHPTLHHPTHPNSAPPEPTRPHPCASTSRNLAHPMAPYFTTPCRPFLPCPSPLGPRLHHLALPMPHPNSCPYPRPHKPHTHVFIPILIAPFRPMPKPETYNSHPARHPFCHPRPFFIWLRFVCL